MLDPLGFGHERHLVLDPLGFGPFLLALLGLPLFVLSLDPSRLGLRCGSLLGCLTLPTRRIGCLGCRSSVGFSRQATRALLLGRGPGRSRLPLALDGFCRRPGFSRLPSRALRLGRGAWLLAASRWRCSASALYPGRLRLESF